MMKENYLSKFQGLKGILGLTYVLIHPQKKLFFIEGKLKKKKINRNLLFFGWQKQWWG